MSSTREETITRQRLAEIEVELRAVIPNDPYDASVLPMGECVVCGGASDDHKANCYVPLVYELLDAATTLQHREQEVRKEERERCAGICDYYREEDGDIASQAAAAIRRDSAQEGGR